jgi:hypothetical protein
MRTREKLLHPATFISLAALFVALGGVGYAATQIGTKQHGPHLDGLLRSGLGSAPGHDHDVDRGLPALGAGDLHELSAATVLLPQLEVEGYPQPSTFG